MPIFVSKDKNENLTCDFAYVDGIQEWGSYDSSSSDSFIISLATMVSLTQEDSEQRISMSRGKKESPKYLSYSQITSVGFLLEKDIKEQNKSVVGRATVGGLLLGPLGAIVGGLSGTGANKRTTHNSFMIINYQPSDGRDEIKVISFKTIAGKPWDKFINALKKKIPQQPKQETSQYL